MPNINLLASLWVVVGIERFKLSKMAKKKWKYFLNFKVSFAMNKNTTIYVDSRTEQFIEKYKMLKCIQWNKGKFLKRSIFIRPADTLGKSE